MQVETWYDYNNLHELETRIEVCVLLSTVDPH